MASTLSLLAGSLLAGSSGYVVSKALGNNPSQSTVAGICAASLLSGGLVYKILSAKKRLGFSKFPVSSSGPVEKMSRDEFVAVFNDLNDELVADLVQYEMTEQGKQHMKRMLDYNVPGGKLNRGLTVVHTAATIKGSALAPEEKKLAAVLGWCIEWMQASFLVADDMMDCSITRRGQPCWYRVEDIGRAAVNDALFLLTHIEIILRKYFVDFEEYLQLHDLLTETTHQTELGQLLDLTTQPIVGPIDLNLYTMDRYLKIVKYKTAFYSFYAPIALGMIVGGVNDDASLKLAREICVKMGTYFQIQDDYLDCYASPEVLGKIGTDIQDKKCSWLVVQAMKVATKAQRKVIEENYGHDDAAKIQVIKDLYVEMGLEAVYHAYEEKVYKELTAQIALVDRVPQQIFADLLNKIYKRQK